MVQILLYIFCYLLYAFRAGSLDSGMGIRGVINGCWHMLYKWCLIGWSLACLKRVPGVTTTTSIISCSNKIHSDTGLPPSPENSLSVLTAIFQVNLG